MAPISRNPGDKPEWHCPAGTVIGVRRDDTNVALGIRYATAKRYEPPRAEPPASSPIIADTASPACPQPHDIFSAAMGDNVLKGLTSDEDCLRLSITCPSDLSASEKVPVMVWIHGGANISGAGDALWYQPTDIVREHRLIVVNLNFRLGFLGYLGQTFGKPANLGLLDQIEAFKWINRNISSFGGDNKNVTAFGQSAGADAIVQLMIAEGAEGLFHRAIIQSPPLGLTYQRATLNEAMLAACSDLTEDSSIEEIQASQTRFLKAMQGIDMPFGTQYGHYPLPPQSEIERHFSQVAKNVDILIGNSARELAIFGYINPTLKWLMTIPGISYLTELFIVKRTSDWMYARPIDVFKNRHGRGGGKGFRYTFNSESTGVMTRATHCSELPYLFTHSPAWKGHPIASGIKWEVLEERGVKLRSIWAEFAAHGTAPVGEIHGLIDVQPLL